MQHPEHQKNINQGMLLGFMAVIVFSLTLPVTRLIIPYFDPVFIGLGRSVVAAIVASMILLAFNKQRFPNKAQLKQLLLTAIGVIVGFPVLTAFAMQTVPASHGSVVIGLLPLLTAIIAVIISNERPVFGFWVAAVVGALLVVVYALLQGGVELKGGLQGGLQNGLQRGDIYLIAASFLGAMGYAVGANIAKEMGVGKSFAGLM